MAMIAEIVLIPESMGLDAAKASAQYVARGLSSAGIKVREHISVCPDTAQFQQAVSTALSRSNILVTLGGMGKESGYMAKTILSRGLGLPLEGNEAALSGIREYCRKTGESFDASDSALAMLPRGAAVFPGDYSKIPGCAISSTKQHIIMLPEVQAEIAPMFNKYVTPYLGGTPSTTVTRTLRTYGVRESAVSDALGELMNAANPAVTVQREENEVLVRVSAHASTAQQAASMCTPVLKSIVDRLGDTAYGLDVDSLQAAVVDKLYRKELDIAIAEAGDGGILTRVISETPRGQDVLRYTIFVDTPEDKEQKLGIKRKMLKKRGNISEFAAVSVAAAAREKAGTKLGVCVLANTGEEKNRKCPIGVVYIAVCDSEYVYIKKLVVGDGDADADVIADAALSRALNMIRLAADYSPEAYPAAIPLEEAMMGDRVITEVDEYETPQIEAGDDEGEPESFWGRFFGNFVIRKSDKRGVKVKKFIFILALLVFLGSAGYIGWHYTNAYIAKKHASELSNMFMFGDMENLEVSPDYPKNYSLKFAGLWNVNNDVTAFVSIPDTGVNYPVVQAADNNYYLRRNFYGNHNPYGVPFMDYRVDVKKPSDNIVVYGHNMKDGQIFGEIISYQKLDYYKEHPVINFTTVYNENKYKIISVFITNAYESQGPVFAYNDYIDAENGDEFMAFVDELKKRSLIDIPVDVKKGDELLTLSTCTYEFKDARLVVVGRAVRKNESADVDVAKAIKNENALMPDIWYTMFGGTKPELEDRAVLEEEPEEESDSLPPSSEPEESEEAESEQTVEEMANADSRSQSESASSRASSSSAPRPASSSTAASQAADSKAAEARAAAESEAAASKAASDAAEASRKAEEEAEASRIAQEEAEAEAERLAQEEQEQNDNGGFDTDYDTDNDTDNDSTPPENEYDNNNAGGFDTDDDTVVAKIVPSNSFVNLSELSAKTSSSSKKKKKTKKTNKPSSTSISVISGNKVYVDEDAYELLPRIVQSEVGVTFEKEAIKAQTVAAYTFIKHSNASGGKPVVGMVAKADNRVIEAVSEVLGEAVYYKSELAFTPYHATSSSSTTSSRAVWGGHYPYLVPVDSAVDKKAPNYKVKTTIDRDRVEELIEIKLGIAPPHDDDDDPADWILTLSHVDGNYNGDMEVCGETRNQITGEKITGRMLRESVFGLRSSCFTVTYNERDDSFTFTTYGYGHGVGMSQNGANLYAKKGWDYKKILEHYYPGTEVK